MENHNKENKGESERRNIKDSLQWRMQGGTFDSLLLVFWLDWNIRSATGSRHLFTTIEEAKKETVRNHRIKAALRHGFYQAPGSR